MYFSKIGFNSQQAMVSCLKQGLYGEHQAIWQLMPHDAEAQRDFLYHREETDSGPIFFVVSARQPTATPEYHVQSKPYQPQLHTGQCLYFKLRANAVKTTRVDGKQYRRDIIDVTVDKYKAAGELPPPSAILHHEAGQAWLTMQGEKHGFAVQDLHVENHQHHRIHKQRSAPMQFGSIDLWGTLLVENPDALRAILMKGVGRSKSFGCGLMLIKPT